MRSEDISLVRALPLFTAVSDATMAALLQASFLQRFPAQVTLISEGSPADFLYLVVDGLVELFASAGGRQTTLAIVRPVTCFSTSAVLANAAYLSSARTLEPSRLLMLPSESVRDAFAGDVGFARALTAELTTAYRGAVKSLKNQKLRPAIERLANYLLQEHRQQGDSGVFTLTVEKQTLASFLGMTAENLSRSFGALAKYGVAVSGREIRISRPADLVALAQPTPLIDDPTA